MASGVFERQEDRFYALGVGGLASVYESAMRESAGWRLSKYLRSHGYGHDVELRARRGSAPAAGAVIEFWYDRGDGQWRYSHDVVYIGEDTQGRPIFRDEGRYVVFNANERGPLFYNAAPSQWPPASSSLAR